MCVAHIDTCVANANTQAHLSKLSNVWLPEHGDLPLWRIHMFLYRGNSVLFFRWHHSCDVACDF